MASVRIVSLDKEKLSGRGARVRILESIDLDIADGELVVLIGPSGCGKTTLLRIVAGLEEPSAGEIWIDGKMVNQVAPRDRDIAMVFQSYALYPHMNVRDNLAFGLRMRRTEPRRIEELVSEAAEMLEIGHLMSRYPRELSGGQRQRVAMGRAVVRRPRVFLFDEPLSNLDAALRQQMRIELLRLHARLGATMIYVTHDQVEAMTLATRIAVLNRGRIEQVGRAAELYERPRNVFVARFLGSPEMNLIDGRVSGGRFVAEDAECGLSLEIPHLGDGNATLGVRPEDLLLDDPGAGGAALAEVDVVEHLGWENLLHLKVGRQVLVARCEARRSPRPAERVGVRLADGRAHLFSRAPRERPGERLDVPA